MNKTVFLMVLLVGLLVGCSSNSNNISPSFNKDAKTVYLILTDYMQNGKEITVSQQRQIDNFETKVRQNAKSYNQNETYLINRLMAMDQDRQNYNVLQDDSSKKLQMSDFNKAADEVKLILNIK